MKSLLMLAVALCVAGNAMAQCGYCNFMPPAGCQFVASCDFKCVMYGNQCQMYSAPGCEGVIFIVQGMTEAERIEYKKPRLYNGELGAWMYQNGATNSTQVPKPVLAQYRDKSALGKKFESFKTQEEAERWLLSLDEATVVRLRASR